MHRRVIDSEIRAILPPSATSWEGLLQGPAGGRASGSVLPWSATVNLSHPEATPAPGSPLGIPSGPKVAMGFQNENTHLLDGAGALAHTP